MSVRTPANLSTAGLTLAPTAADVAGDEWDNTGAELLHVHNGGAGAITVTRLVRQSGPDGATITNPTVSVPAGARMLIGPFNPAIYNDGNNRAKVTYSGVTSVSVQVARYIEP